MTSAVLLVVAVGFLVAALHPYVTYPISLKMLAYFYRRPVVLRPILITETPRVALCLCAYNEQHVIRAKVHNMLAMRNSVPNLDILVYVDAASDKTSEILSEFGDSIHLVVSPSRFGKTYGMNLLVQLTCADLIIFTDANVIFSDDALVHLLRPFGDPEVGCTLGHLRYVSGTHSSTTVTGSFYWNLEEKIKALESLTGSAITADGAIFAIRRSLHRPPPPDVSDDIYLSLSILCAGYRVVRVADAIAYEEAVSSAAEEFDRKIRIACLAFTVHRIFWPQLLHLRPLNFYKYVSHKLLRWLTIYLLAAGATSFVLALLASIGWLPALVATVLGLSALWVVSLSRTGPLGRFNSVLQAFVATGIGVWRSLEGTRFQTWTPPASTREQIGAAQNIAAAERAASSLPTRSKIDA